MATYKVTLLMTLEDGSHPRKWIAETITDVLSPNEELLDWNVVEVEVENIDGLGEDK